MRGPVAGVMQQRCRLASEEKFRRSTSKVDEVEDELKAIKQVITDNTDLQRLLYHHRLPLLQKKKH